MDDPFGFRFAGERVVEVRPVPVHVADLVMRAGRDEQLALVLPGVSKGLTGTMEKEREAALEATGHVRARTLPRPPLRKHTDSRQLVAIGQFLEQQVGQRRGRLADRESWMAAALDEHDPPSPPFQTECRQGAGKS